MDQLPLQPDHLHEQALGEPVLAHTRVASVRPSGLSSRCRSPSTLSRPSRSIRATVCDTVGPGHRSTACRTFDQSIFNLYQQGFVTIDEALRWASNVDEFKLKVQGISTTADIARDEMAEHTGQGSPEITRFGG